MKKTLILVGRDIPKFGVLNVLSLKYLKRKYASLTGRAGHYRVVSSQDDKQISFNSATKFGEKFDSVMIHAHAGLDSTSSSLFEERVTKLFTFIKSDNSLFSDYPNLKQLREKCLSGQTLTKEEASASFNALLDIIKEKKPDFSAQYISESEDDARGAKKNINMVFRELDENQDAYGIIFERSPKFIIDLFSPEGEKYINDEEDFLEKIKLLHQRTGAANFYISACQSGAFINYLNRISQTNPEKFKELGLGSSINIMVFNSHESLSLFHDTDKMTDLVLNYNGDIDEKFSREISLDFGITVKSCKITQDGRFELGNKYNLHKHPELYEKLKNPDDERVLEKWRILSEKKKELELKKSTSGLNGDEIKEFKRLNELFFLSDLYKDIKPEEIPESFVNQAFLESALRGNVERMKAWVRLGANVNFHEGLPSAFALVSHFDCLDALKYIIDNGDPEALLHINHGDKFGMAPLHYVVERGNIETLQYLLEKGANIKQVAYDGRTALHCAVHGKCTKEIIKLLFENGVRNTASDAGWTPLKVAMKLNKLSAVEWIIEYLDPKEIKDHFIFAIRNNYLKSAKVILKSKSVDDKSINEALTAAISSGNLDMVEFFSSKCDVTRSAAYKDPRSVKNEKIRNFFQQLRNSNDHGIKHAAATQVRVSQQRSISN